MIFRTFLDKKHYIDVVKAEGINLYSKSGKKFIDLTGGITGHAILGWGNKKVISSIKKQTDKFGHVDYKTFKDHNREELAKLLVSKTRSKLNRVFFVGSSGSEACEAAIKMSYQYFYDKGHKNKNIFISRKQSYHGSTSQALSLGDRPNLNFFKGINNKNVVQISEHNQFRNKKINESDQEYAVRCINELEKAILKIGPERVCGFVGETIMGGLVGDVPPPKNYWAGIRRVCSKYNVHLILDEVWCGTGTSGKIYCIDWDKVNPDFVFVGKTLAAGYGAVSAVITNEKIENGIKRGQKQVQYSNTHQGHSLNVAAALSVQKIIHGKNFLKSVVKKGELIREMIHSELKNYDFYLNVRGRGMRNTLEYNCDNKPLFGALIKNRLFNKHQLIVDAKWHRICFPMSLQIKEKEIIENFEKLFNEFKSIQKEWSSLKKKKIEDFNY